MINIDRFIQHTNKILFRDYSDKHVEITFLDVVRRLRRGGLLSIDTNAKTVKGVKVVDGDDSDLRFLDGSGVVVGLKAKGKAKKDTSGFVVG